MDQYSEKVILSKEHLQQINEENILQYFGDWTQNIDQLHQQFNQASPYPHVVLPNFLNSEYAEKIYSLYPEVDNTWHKYCNPIEVKFAYDNINQLPEELKNYFYFLSSNQMVNIFQNLTGIEELTHDEYLHGAGLHAHPRNGRLSIHLDYEKHPISGKERRTNIILFMTKNWNPEWNGANELWDNECNGCVVKNEICFNTAVVFRTNNTSWHGVPDIIKCPEGQYRKSLAYYYVSPLSSIKKENEYRYKAKFVKKPDEVISEGIQKLYDIRPNRRITPLDLERYAPEWTPEN